MMDYIVKQMGMTVEYFPALDGNWGALSDEKKNLWNGMIGMVQRGETDTAVGGITITQSRSTVVDFSFPYVLTATGFIANVPREKSKRAALLRPFDLSVWMPEIIAVVLMPPLYWWFSRVRPALDRPPMTFFKSLEFITLIVVQQNTAKFHTGLTMTILFVMWSIFCFIISNAYRGSLMSSLMLPSYSEPLETLEDLLDNKKIEIITVNNTAYQQYMKYGPNKVLMALEKRMDLEHTVLQSNPASETYPDSNRVVIDDGIILKLILDKPSGVKIDQKNIYLGKQYFLSSGYGFPLTKGSLLRSHVDKWLMRSLEFGLDKKWYLTVDLEQREKLRRMNNTRSSFQEKNLNIEVKLSMDHLQGIFITFIFLIFISSLSFVIELFLFDKRKGREQYCKTFLSKQVIWLL